MVNLVIVISAYLKVQQFVYLTVGYLKMLSVTEISVKWQDE
jgi:hypothetical protein